MRFWPLSPRDQSMFWQRQCFKYKSETCQRQQQCLHSPFSFALIAYAASLCSKCQGPLWSTWKVEQNQTGLCSIHSESSVFSNKYLAMQFVCRPPNRISPVEFCLLGGGSLLIDGQRNPNLLWCSQLHDQSCIQCRLGGSWSSRGHFPLKLGKAPVCPMGLLRSVPFMQLLQIQAAVCYTARSRSGVGYGRGGLSQSQPPVLLSLA